MPPVSDTNILLWQPDFLADDTNSPSQSDWETGVMRDLDDEFRNIKSVVRSWSVPPDNKVWEAVESPNVHQFVQHGSHGFSIRVELLDIVARLEPLQVLKAVRGANTYYFTITNAVFESNSTIIQVSSLPVQFTTTWVALVGNVLTTGFSVADPAFAGPFSTYVSGSPPVTGKQGLVIYDSIGAKFLTNGICDQIDDTSFSTDFTLPGLLSQGRLTSPTQVLQTWAINVYPYISGVAGSPDPFIDSIWLGSKPSLFASSNQSGQAVVNGDGTAGPYTLSNLPRAEPDADYSVLLQVKATTIATPTYKQLTWHASTKTENNFSLQSAEAIPNGSSVTFDWLVMR